MGNSAAETPADLAFSPRPAGRGQDEGQDEGQNTRDPICHTHVVEGRRKRGLRRERGRTPDMIPPRALTETVVSGSFSRKPSRQSARLHSLEESGTMRLQIRSLNYALPLRGSCRLSRNRDRVHSLGHSVASPQSSPHRPSECDAGTSSHKVPANNLAKIATSPSGSRRGPRIPRPRPGIFIFLSTSPQGVPGPPSEEPTQPRSLPTRCMSALTGSSNSTLRALDGTSSSCSAFHSSSTSAQRRGFPRASPAPRPQQQLCTATNRVRQFLENACDLGTYGLPLCLATVDSTRRRNASSVSVLSLLRRMRTLPSFPGSTGSIIGFFRESCGWNH